MAEEAAEDLAAVVPLVFLPPGSASRLLAEAARATLRPGDFALKRGERPTELVIPLRDLRETLDGGGVWRPVPAFEPVGLHCLVRGEASPASVVAAKETAVLRLDWASLRESLREVPGLPEYLALVSGSAAAAELDRALSELGCTTAFRAAFIGSLERRSWMPGSWLACEGETPPHALYCVLGTTQAFKRGAAGALRPLWAAPNLSWQLWKACLEGQPLGYGLEALTAVEGFAVSRARLRALRETLPGDFSLFAQAAARAAVAAPGAQNEGLDVERLEDLFPPPPRPVKGRRWRYPFVPQAEEMECGPACLAMISKYYGNDLPIQYWWERMNVGQEGCTLFDMARAAEKAGFVTHGLQVADLFALEAQLFPLVALRDSHFVVVYRAKRGELLVGDPAVGVGPVKLGEFSRGFDGVVLMLKPTEAFFQEKAPVKPYLQYLALLRGHEVELGLIAATSGALTLLSMLPAFLSQFVIDQVLGNADGRMLLVALFGMLVVQSASALLSWTRTYYIAFLSARFDFASSSAFWRRLLALPYDFFARRHIGDFTRRLGQLESIRRFVVHELIGTFLDLVNLVFYGAVLWLYSPAVATAVFLSAPALVAVSALFSSRLRRLSDEVFRARAEQDSLLADQLKGVATIKTLGAEVAARWRFEESLARALKAEYRFDQSAAALGGISSLLNSAIRLGILGLACSIALKGKMTPGQVIAVASLAAGVVGPFRNLAGLWSEVQRLRNVVDRLNDVFLATPEAAPSQRAVMRKRLRGELEFRGVWFRYGGESSEWALKGLSFRVLPGQKAAIVGPSGAGKSTLALLATRLYEPERGSILIDGRDCREYDRGWLRTQIGLLLPDPALFHGTLLENIAYSDPQPDLTRVSRCIEAAGAAGFIAEKATGLEYRISHGGLGLSSGQRQRISIARTLYADPAVLFLDESTSSIDAKGERAILSGLRAAFEGRTILSIAHRRQTIEWADFVLVVADGRLAECGTHAELMRGGGVYADLFQGTVPS